MSNKPCISTNESLDKLRDSLLCVINHDVNNDVNNNDKENDNGFIEVRDYTHKKSPNKTKLLQHKLTKLAKRRYLTLKNKLKEINKNKLITDPQEIRNVDQLISKYTCQYLGQGPQTSNNTPCVPLNNLLDKYITA